MRARARVHVRVPRTHKITCGHGIVATKRGRPRLTYARNELAAGSPHGGGVGGEVRPPEEAGGVHEAVDLAAFADDGAEERVVAPHDIDRARVHEVVEHRHGADLDNVGGHGPPPRPCALRACGLLGGRAAAECEK